MRSSTFSAPAPMNRPGAVTSISWSFSKHLKLTDKLSIKARIFEAIAGTEAGPGDRQRHPRPVRAAGHRKKRASVSPDLKALLEKVLKELSDAAAVLGLSYEKCKGITVRPGLSNDQLESFEALTARFARLSDLLVQKALRTMDAIDLEDPGTVRDRINRAEKKGIVKSAETLVRIRMLRNEIAHEYTVQKRSWRFSRMSLS